jgi:hypothetical protein
MAKPKRVPLHSQAHAKYWRGGAMHGGYTGDGGAEPSEKMSQRESLGGGKQQRTRHQFTCTSTKLSPDNQMAEE